MKLLETPVKPDFPGMIDCVVNGKKPDRVYHIELYLDEEIKDAVAKKYDLLKELNPSDPHYKQKREIAVQRFLGYDMLRVNVPGFDFPLTWSRTDDATADAGQKRDSRDWVEEHEGPVQSWEDFEAFPWPKIEDVDFSEADWYEKNLPDDMAMYELTTHVFEILAWIFGYETLCYKIYDDPELVEAVADKIGKLYLEYTRALMQYSRMGVAWASDDMGFKTQPLLSPDSLRRLVLPWHKKSAEIANECGKPYFLHACGHLEAVMDDLIDDVGVQAKHSFEDEIIPVEKFYEKYKGRVGVMGGLDMDLLCRGSQEDIRGRTRALLETCHGGGGYALGSGNSLANYVPLENYLYMLDEGRRFI